MNQRAKLIARIRSNPKDVRFDDACRAAESIEFVHKSTRGSHWAFSRTGEPSLLVFQNRGGKISAYQTRQLIVMLDKYEQ